MFSKNEIYFFNLSQISKIAFFSILGFLSVTSSYASCKMIPEKNSCMVMTGFSRDYNGAFTPYECNADSCTINGIECSRFDGPTDLLACLDQKGAAGQLTPQSQVLVIGFAHGFWSLQDGGSSGFEEKSVDNFSFLKELGQRIDQYHAKIGYILDSCNQGLLSAQYSASKDFSQTTQENLCLVTTSGYSLYTFGRVYIDLWKHASNLADLGFALMTYEDQSGTFSGFPYESSNLSHLLFSSFDQDDELDHWLDKNNYYEKLYNQVETQNLTPRFKDLFLTSVLTNNPQFAHHTLNFIDHSDFTNTSFRNCIDDVENKVDQKLQNIATDVSSSLDAQNQLNSLSSNSNISLQEHLNYFAKALKKLQKQSRHNYDDAFVLCSVFQYFDKIESNTNAQIAEKTAASFDDATLSSNCASTYNLCDEIIKSSNVSIDKITEQDYLFPFLLNEMLALRSPYLPQQKNIFNLPSIMGPHELSGPPATFQDIFLHTQVKQAGVQSTLNEFWAMLHKIILANEDVHARLSDTDLTRQNACRQFDLLAFKDHADHINESSDLNNADNTADAHESAAFEVADSDPKVVTSDVLTKAGQEKNATSTINFPEHAPDGEEALQENDQEKKQVVTSDANIISTVPAKVLQYLFKKIQAFF